MPSVLDEGRLLKKGRAALADARWKDARAVFDEALRSSDAAELHDGQATALWWLGEVPAAVERRERAYVAFLDGGKSQEAAVCAVWLAREHRAAFGNVAVSGGWMARAARHLAEEGRCRARALLAVTEGRFEGDSSRAAALFADAMAMAREVGDRDIEILALSCLGRAQVEGGDFDGFARLDEAMVAANAGELRDHQMIADVQCNLVIASEAAYEFARAEEWSRVVAEWCRRRGCLPLFAYCRIAHGAVLFAHGRWAEAEDELVDALRRYEATHPPMACIAAGRLAELKLFQGAVDEAESLIRGCLEHPAVAIAAARLHLARGDAELAASRLERRAAVVANCASALAPVLVTLVDIHLARGDRASARDAAARLHRVAAAQRGLVLVAIAQAARGETGDSSEAVASLHAALEAFETLGLRFHAAKTRLAIARALAASKPDVSRAEALTALRAFEQLGAAPFVAEAAKLGAKSAAPAARRRTAIDALTRREAEVLRLLGQGLSNPAIASRLDISPKTAEHHVGRILSKLDLPNRATAAAWVASRAPRNDLP